MHLSIGIQIHAFVTYVGMLKSVLAKRDVGSRLLKALTPAVLERDPKSLVKSRDKSLIEASGIEAYDR